MAMPVQPLMVGIDTAKNKLDVVVDGQPEGIVIDNTPKAIRRFIKTLPAGSAIAIEATGTFHVELVELAHAAEVAVYVINAHQLSHYRKGIGGRAKTDRTDAQLLLRYLKAERDELRPWQPPRGPYRAIQMLLRRRARLVQARTSLQQSFADLPELKAVLRPVQTQISRAEALIERRLRELLREHGLLAEVKRCEAIEGVGFLTATALVMISLRGDFKSSDAFIAFIGMDVRVRESGTFSGRRKLTKQGDREVRRLLHNAAMAASRSGPWKALYERYLSAGKSKTQALVALARKLARIAFALIRSGETYSPAAA
jgi:transposase